jgi:enamine deaminase RidA (YjgF/YER057c/UK114 family)
MNSLVKRIHANTRFSQATIFQNTMYLTGQVALNNPDESIEIQMEEILNSIDGLLEDGGTDKSNLLMANIWLRRIEDYDRMNKIWDKWIEANMPPSRACVQANLVSSFKVEISVVAAIIATQVRDQIPK